MFLITKYFMGRMLGTKYVNPKALHNAYIYSNLIEYHIPF